MRWRARCASTTAPFQDYLQGRHRPAPHIRVRIANLAGERDYEAWINRALEDTQKAFYDRVRQRRQREKAEARLKAVEAGKNTGLLAKSHARIPISEEEAEHLRDIIKSRLHKLKSKRKKAARLLETRTRYLLDDRLNEALSWAQLQHVKLALSIMESNGAPSEVLNRQRENVSLLETAYRPFILRTDLHSHASLRLERLAVADLNAAIQLREAELEALRD